jgi:hypothetical protein
VGTSTKSRFADWQHNVSLGISALLLKTVHVGGFVQFIAFCGVCMTEAANVIWSDANFARGTILLRIYEERRIPQRADDQ